MTNYERFEKEIVEIIGEFEDIALPKSTMKPSCCTDISCSACAFRTMTSDCGAMRKKWLLEEYKEPIVLTEFEREVLKRALQQGYKFVARDKNENLFFANKVYRKESTYWSVEDDADFMNVLQFFKSDFLFVKWEDKEPRIIEELLKEVE